MLNFFFTLRASKLDSAFLITFPVESNFPSQSLKVESVACCEQAFLRATQESFSKAKTKSRWETRKGKNAQTREHLLSFKLLVITRRTKSSHSLCSFSTGCLSVLLFDILVFLLLSCFLLFYRHLEMSYIFWVIYPRQNVNCLYHRHLAPQNILFFFLRRIRRISQAFLLLLVSPPMILFLLSLAYNALTSEVDADFASIFSSSLTTVHQALTSSIREARMLGTWSFAMTCLGVLPNWLMFWCLAWYWATELLAHNSLLRF